MLRKNLAGVLLALILLATIGGLSVIRLAQPAHAAHADGLATQPASDIAHACNSVDTATQGVVATINGNTATYYFYPGNPFTVSPNGQCVQFFVSLRLQGYIVSFPG